MRLKRLRKIFLIISLNKNNSILFMVLNRVLLLLLGWKTNNVFPKMIITCFDSRSCEVFMRSQPVIGVDVKNGSAMLVCFCSYYNETGDFVWGNWIDAAEFSISEINNGKQDVYLSYEKTLDVDIWRYLPFFLYQLLYKERGY